MSFWADASWKLLNIPTKKHIFHLETEARILAIIGNAQGVQTPMTGLYRTVERFRRCVRFLQEHGTIQDPLVGAWTKEGFYLVDGHDRLAAVVYVALADNFDAPVWVAEIAAAPT